MNNDLIDWVKRSLRSGYSEKSLGMVARAFGWGEDSLQNAIDKANKQIYMGYFYRLSGFMIVVFVFAVVGLRLMTPTGMAVDDSCIIDGIVANEAGCCRATQPLECFDYYGKIQLYNQELNLPVFCTDGVIKVYSKKLNCIENVLSR